MNFGVIKAAFNTVRGFTVQHSPEILLGVSIASGVGATIMGCVATKKMEAINAKHKEALDILHKSSNDGVIKEGEIIEAKETPEYKRALMKEYGRYWFDIAKTWAPCVALTLASGTSALASFKIINGRLIKTELAFAGVSKAFEQYRDNVIEDQGEEKDLYYANNGALKKKQELIAKGKYKEKAIVDKDNKPAELKINKVDGIFHYLFCKENVKWACWSDHPWYNNTLLSQAQTMFNHNLETNGYVLLDDVYTYLGLDTSELMKEKIEGRTYGWTLDCFTEDGMPNDQHVLFGIYEYNDTQHRLFRAGQINEITLHFNCRLLTPKTCELIARGNHL